MRWIDLTGPTQVYIFSISALGLLVMVFILGYAWGSGGK